MRRTLLGLLPLLLAAGCEKEPYSFLRPQATSYQLDKLERLRGLFAQERYGEVVRKAPSRYGMGAPVAEEARLLRAEAYFRLDRPYKAYREYDELVDRFPFHPSMEQVGERLYSIGHRAARRGKDEIDGGWWFSGVGVRKVLERSLSAAPYGEFADETRWWLGRLSLAKGEYDAAARWYAELADLQSGSPWAPQALLAAAQARLKLYEGPAYDSTNLLEAEALALKYRRRFPGGAELPQVESLLHSIRVMKAERDRKAAGLYRHLGYPDSAREYEDLAREIEQR